MARREVSSGGLVVNSEGEVLLLRDRHGRWALPKGHREQGERLADTARREVWEETGVEAAVWRVLGRHRYPLPERPGVEKVVVFMLLGMTGGALRSSDEVSDACFLPWPEAEIRLRQGGYPGYAEMLRTWLDRRVPEGLNRMVNQDAASPRNGDGATGRVDRI